ncbi:carboxylesterase type B [Variovorax soli]|uniref:Carboxylic ester hydrolase n=1 Tax=Variovorax soli TaxID=376815 RepID=A0ABU1NDS3_9BURK|nr:carboxylesterase type B [Variovorax soli]
MRKRIIAAVQRCMLPRPLRTDAALRWLQANIAAFGGDPSRVCVVGQSGGAMHAAMLAQNPAYRRTFQKAVLLSPSSLVPPPCADIPFLFGTNGLDDYRDEVGSGADETSLANQFASATVSFAGDAQPKLASGAAWPVAGHRHVAALGRELGMPCWVQSRSWARWPCGMRSWAIDR